MGESLLLGVVTYHSGGGVANYGGTLTMMNSTITGNSAAEYAMYTGSLPAALAAVWRTPAPSP